MGTQHKGPGCNLWPKPIDRTLSTGVSAHVSPEAVEYIGTYVSYTRSTGEEPKEHVACSPNIIAPATNDTLLSAFGPERDGVALATAEGIRTAINW